MLNPVRVSLAFLLHQGYKSSAFDSIFTFHRSTWFSFSFYFIIYYHRKENEEREMGKKLTILVNKERI